MPRVYTSKLTVRCWKEHLCIGCNAKYAYRLVRQARGKAENPVVAQLLAERAVEKIVAREVDAHPCPSCGLVQPDMIGQQRARVHGWTLGLAIACGIPLAFARSTGMIRADHAVWTIAAVCAAAALVLLVSELVNPNRDLGKNLRRARERVAAGRVRVRTPGRSGAPAGAALPDRRTVRALLLLPILAAAPFAAQPEILRTSEGWPLNVDCYPPVVGPGETIRVQMQTAIVSIKGSWRGRPEVSLSADGDRAPVHASASTQHDTWAQTIYAKSREKYDAVTPWVDVRLPDHEGLAGKVVKADIDLDVEYPAPNGDYEYRDASIHTHRTVPIAVAATPGAGERYEASWRGSTLGALALTALGVFGLFAAASALQRRAGPTCVYSTYDVPADTGAPPPAEPAYVGDGSSWKRWIAPSAAALGLVMVGFGIWRAIHEGHRDSGPAPTVTPAAAVPPAPTATAVATPVVLPVDVADGARVSPGAFSMGSPASERGRNGDESQHLVTITRAYWLKRTEVTQQEWTDVMASNPSRFKSCGAACPVENVNWYEAVAYCNALSARQNVERCYLDGSKDYDQESAATQTTPSWPKGLDCSGYRLPTEAEWEYAARAGTKGAFFTGEIAETACQGDPNLDKAGWYCGNAQETTHPVAQKAANAWGMYDMLGNVGEWVWDFQTDVGGAAQRDPVGRLAGALRVFRGGSWGRNAGDTRAASRDSDAPRSRNGSVGFRPARTIP